MQVISRRPRGKDATTPEASRRSLRKSRKSSGTSSIDTKGEAGGKDKKGKVKSTLCGELCRAVCHLIFVFALILGTVIAFEYKMKRTIEWEPPKHQEPQLKKYYGASIITKDFDCSILARRCFMAKKKLRTCFAPALMCNAMLRPDMFPVEKKNKFYYINVRHLTSEVDDMGKKKEVFHTFHDKVKRAHILDRLNKWNKNFKRPLTNSKGMPRDNQLFFIPWEILDQEEKYKKNLDYVDLNMDDVFDCIQPKVNTDLGRRDWIKSMNWKAEEVPDKSFISNSWHRDTTLRAEHFRVDTVPGFAGAFVKKIVEASTAIIEHELAHSARGDHPFTDAMLLLVYHNVLLHALRNPFLMIFREDKWLKKKTPYGDFHPLKGVTFNDFDKMPRLVNASSSISFLFGAHKPNSATKLPDTLTVTISEAKAKLGIGNDLKDFDLNVPIRISNGLNTAEIVSSAQGERAFHANIITALRNILRLRMYKDRKINLNHLLHIPMAFYSMEERKMVFDSYNMTAPLRQMVCKNIELCATPYDQNSIDWQTRFNGTTAIQSHGRDKAIFSRVDTTQDKRNYPVGY